MFGLAIAYLRDKPLTTLLNILLLGLATATLIILVTVSTQLGTRIDRDAKGIDLVVGAKGSPLQLILSSIYQIDSPTGNIPVESVDLLRRDPSVARVVPLALGDNFRGFRIVGTEPAYFDLYGAKLASGRMNVASGEALLGADVAKATGAALGQKFVGSHGLGSAEGAGEHEANPFTTVGILTRTGTVIDRLIITSIPSVWDVHGIAHDHDKKEGKHKDGAPHNHEDHDHEAESGGATAVLPAEVTALLIKYRNATGAIRIPSFVNAQQKLQSAVPAIETTRLLSFLGAGLDAVQLLAWLIALTGGLSIFVALLNAMDTRKGDLALLRVMGASRSSVFATVLTEGIITAGSGVLLGVLLGHLAIAAATANFIRLEQIGLDPFAFHPAELMIVAGVLAIGVIAALIPAIRLFRSDLNDALTRA
jgi:putative ABC transport system permease protein